MAVLAIYIKLSPLPIPDFEGKGKKAESTMSIFQHPNLVLGAVTLFFYVGAEVVAGDTIGLFGRQLGVENFGQLTAYTMAFMMCGYILGLILIPRVLSQEGALAASAILGVVLSLAIVNADLTSTGIWTTFFGWVSVPAIPNAVLLVALLGLANALVWPAVWPLALRGLNEAQTGTGSAFLIMGIAGGAILPVIFGAITDVSADPRTAYWIMLPCYFFILYYALVGHKLNSWGYMLSFDPPNSPER